MELEHIACFNPIACISGKVMKIGRVTSAIFRKHLNPFQVTNSQLSLLFILTKRGGVTQKQLAEITQLEKSSLNRNLTRLFEKGFLTKDSFPIIEITDEGKTFVNAVIPVWEKAMAEIRQILGDDGEEALSLVLNKLLTKK